MLRRQPVLLPTSFFFFKFRLTAHHEEMWGVDVYIRAFMNSAIDVGESSTLLFRYVSSREQALVALTVKGNC